MRHGILIGICAAALAGACTRNADEPRRTPRTEQPAPAARGGGPENFVQGTGETLESAGHGVVYGAREVGQTLSGTQGNAEAERRSQEAKQRMVESARQAEQHFDQVGDSVQRSAQHADEAAQGAAGDVEQSAEQSAERTGESVDRTFEGESTERR